MAPSLITRVMSRSGIHREEILIKKLSMVVGAEDAITDLFILMTTTRDDDVLEITLSHGPFALGGGNIKIREATPHPPNTMVIDSTIIVENDPDSPVATIKVDMDGDGVIDDDRTGTASWASLFEWELNYIDIP